MAQVKVEVAGNSYTLACADGEQERLEQLVARVDTHASTIKSKLGHVNEAKLMLMAAVLLADEVDDLKAGETLKSDDQEPSTEDDTGIPEDVVASILDEIASEVEAVALRMRGDGLAANG